MFEWAAGKIKRTWRDVGRRLRRWGYAAGLAVTVPWVVYRVIYGLKAVQAMASTLAVPLAAVGLASTAMIVAGWVVGFWRRTAPESTLRFCEEGGYIELVSAMGTKRYALDQIDHAHFIEPTDGPLGVLEVAAKAGSLTRVSIDAAQARDLLARTKLGPRHRAHRIQSQVTGCLGMGLAGYLLLIPSLAAGAAFLLGPIVALENFVTTANTTEGLTLLIVLGFQALMFAGALDVLRVMLQWVLGQEIHLGTDGIRWGKRPWRKFLAYRDIATMEFSRKLPKGSKGPMVSFVTKDGQHHRIMLHGLFTGAQQSVQARLQGVLDQTAEVLMPQLTRQGRSDEEWRYAMRALIEHRDDYRRAPVPRQRVREILEDPAAPPEQRLGAAVALVEAQDEQGLRILTDVSAATADPELRLPLTELAKQAEALLAEEYELQLEEAEQAEVAELER